MASHQPSSSSSSSSFMWAVMKLVIVMVMVMVVNVEGTGSKRKLLFDGKKGEFKILQVADMHYANGRDTPCLDVEDQTGCSDLNTTAFLNRLIVAEKPDMIVFTGDNIFGYDSNNWTWSQTAAFWPAMAAGIPFAAVLGNHDQEGTPGREALIKQIASMPGSQTRVNPPRLMYPIDGFGNYHVPVTGPLGSNLTNRPIFNLYFFDSGDYTNALDVSFYDWVKPSQLLWFRDTSRWLRSRHGPSSGPAPALAFFHIPLKEFAEVDLKTRVGVFQEAGVSSADVNSGLFATMAEAGDVKAVLVGHDHLNDFCGELSGVNLCYGGGFGYHAYGKVGWARRARVVVASLKKEGKGKWGGVDVIRTWKRLDDANLSTIDVQTLWQNASG